MEPTELKMKTKKRNNPTTIRFNQDKEKELYEFFKQKGFKAGIRFLYDYYNNTEGIIAQLKSNTEIRPKRLQDVAVQATEFNTDDEFVKNF